MAAIITPRFRKNNAAAFKADLTTAPSDYYIGLGRPDAWPNDAAPPTPTGSTLELIQAKTGLIQLKEIRTTIDGASGDSSISRMIPRVDWVSGRTFKAYAIGDITRLYSSISGSITTYPCYCINENRLYLCTTAGGGAVANAPTHTTGPSTGGDLYTWTFLRTLTSPATVLNLQNFVPIPDSDSQTLELLPSWYIGIGVNINSADLLLNSKYRQVSVVKWNNGFTGSSKINLVNAQYFNFSSAVSPVPAVGSIITLTSAAFAAGTYPRGVVAAVSSDNLRVYYIQTPDATGAVTAFTGTTISINGAATLLNHTGTIGTALTDFGVLTKTSNIPQGDVVFLENRQPVTHISNQIEEVRTVIQF